MAEKLINFLAKLATGKVIIVLLLVTIAVNVFALPSIYPSFATLDIQPSYTPDQAYTLMSSYGEQGLQYYTLIELTLDLVYPLISALLFSTVAIYFFRKVFPPGSFLQKLPLLPLLVMAIDYLENVSIVIMLQRFPQRLDRLAQAANLFTFTKFWLSWPELILVVVGLAGWLTKKVLPRVKKRTAA